MIFTVGTGNPYIFVIHRRIPKKIEASRFCSRTIQSPTRAKGDLKCFDQNANANFSGNESKRM